MKINKTIFTAVLSTAAIMAFSCASDSKITKGGNMEDKDKSITFEKGAVNEYGTKMTLTKEIKVKADSSSSIVVDWKNEKTVEVPNVTAKEEKAVVYKKSVVTDGYKKGEELDLHMDIMYHDDASSPQPVVLFIPGGGFIGCDSQNSLRLERQYLAENGFAVASIEYHVVGNGFYSDAVQDVRDAMKFLSDNAEKYNIDTSRLALMGNSAGGYMTALVTAMDSTSIRASIDLYGLSDLTMVGMDFDDECKAAHHSPTSSESQYVNGVFSGKAINEDLEKAAKANPLTYIGGNECPMLIMHGDSDSLVSSSQSLLVHEALLKAGVPSTRYSLVGAEHGRGGFNTEPALKTMIDFLRANLN